MPELSTVATFRYRFEADQAKALLETEDIPAMVSGDDAAGWLPYLPFGEGGMALVVWAEDAERAREILEAVSEE